MGKVRDEAPAKATKAAAKPAPPRGARGRVASFVANLLRSDTFKPMQGVYARTWTAVGLGLLVAAGILRFYQIYLEGQAAPAVRFGVPALLLAASGWLIFRIVQYPPFADFLIATEAEMNKVSWTSRDDLYRATVVVLTTVLLMAVYLFVVDYIWSSLLQIIGVLRFTPASPEG